mgnify:CR=1 FL=1
MKGTKKQVRLYDFRSPDKFSKEQIRTLALMHENFARIAQTALSAQMRMAIQLQLVFTEQTPYQQFLRSLRDPVVLAVLNMPPLPGNALLDLESHLVFSLVDRLLGGPGTSPDLRRSLTEIESSMLRRILAVLLDSLTEAWRNVGQVRAALESVETNPLFAQFLPPGEMVVLLGFRCQMGKAEGSLRLCLPYSLLEPVLPYLTARYWMLRQAGKEEASPERMAENLRPVRVPLSVELGRRRLRMEELLRLKVGDVVVLERGVGEPLEVFVRNRLKFRARPGRLGRFLAVEILERVEGEEADER